MFVSKSKYDAMERRANSLERLASKNARAYNALNARWNELVAKINKKGGVDFLDNAKIMAAPQFSTEELIKLIQLCHPDKHDGKPLATEMTQRLLIMKSAVEKEPA